MDLGLDDEIAKIHAQATADELAAEEAAKREFDKIYYQTIIDTATTSIARARSSAEFVEKAATAISGLYAAVVGVSSSVTDHPISARALLPVIFLALAVVGSMVYLAFPTPGTGTAALVPTTVRPERMRRQMRRYLAMVRELNQRRVYFLRASVVALAVAVTMLPAPFIDDREDTVATEEAAPDLPPVPEVGSEAEATLAAIRYEAEVAEAVAARDPGTAPQRNWPAWAWLLLVGGVLVTFGVPLLVGRSDAEADDDDDDDDVIDHASPP